MILDVPLIRQSENSLEYGLAGLAIILKFYSIEISLEKLKKELVVDETGTYAPQLGSYLLKNGFDVEIITMHPALFTNKLKLSGKEEFIEHFNKLRDEAKSEKIRKYCHIL